MSLRLRPVPGLSAVLLAVTIGAAEAGDLSLGLGGGVARSKIDRFVDFTVDFPYWTAGFRVRQASAPPVSALLEVEIGRLSKSQESTTNSQEVLSYKRSARRDLHLGVNLLVETPGDRVRFFIGPGLGAHFLEDEFTQTATYPLWPYANWSYASNTSETKLGFHALAGLEARVSHRFGLCATARYDYLKADAPSMIKLYGGLWVDLLKAPPAAR